MKVILTQDVKSLGKKGDIVNVSEGYANNALFPKKAAVPATDSAVKNQAEKDKVEKVKEAKLLAQAKELAEKLSSKPVIMKSKAGNEGKLYGTITAKEVAVEVKNQLGYDIDKRKIHIDDHIKVLGSHIVHFKLHPQVSVNVTIKVEEIK
ncbi:MAG: 50S ribosomal protein L9 [Candidatus Sericytochromatia bacterium]